MLCDDFVELTIVDNLCSAMVRSPLDRLREDCVVCCEILDSRTRSVVQLNETVSKLADFVRSNSIISRLLAMVAERREIRLVVDELLGAEGSEVSYVYMYAVVTRKRRLHLTHCLSVSLTVGCTKRAQVRVRLRDAVVLADPHARSTEPRDCGWVSKGTGCHAGCLQV